jgi:hypothetical protein
VSLWALYRSTRRAWSAACDRVGEAVETASIASHAWPRAVNRVARPSLVTLGETAAWLRLSPRQPVWRVDSASGPVTVVGDYLDFKQLDDVLATSLEVVPPEHARVGLWQLRSMIAEALARGEVCIAGLPRHLGTLLLPSAEVRFSLDAFVRHVVTLMGPRAMLVEEGLNEALADEPYFRALQGALKRAAIAWARSVGATELSLGLSPAAAAHGIFKAKRLWGAIPEPARRPLAPTWTVMARHLPSDLRRLINSRRGAVFSDGRPCVLRVAGPDGTWEGAERSAADLRRDGFEAVLEAGHGPARVRPLEDAGAKV